MTLSLLPAFLRGEKEIIAAARACLEGGELERAASLYGQLKKCLPAETADSFCLQAEIALARGETNIALDLARSGLNLEPEHGSCHRVCGTALETLGRPEEAAKAYRQALHWTEDETKAAIGLARIEKSRGNLITAEELLAAALEKEPDQPELLADLADTLCRLNRFAEARPCVEACLVLDPHNITALRSLYSISLDAGILPDTVEACDRLIRVQPAVAAWQVMKAATLAAKGIAPPALAAAQRALLLEPDNVEALRLAAGCLMAMGWWVDIEVEEAIFQLLDRALELAPTEARADLLATKADFLAKTGKSKEAFAIVDAMCPPQVTTVNVAALTQFLSLATKFQGETTARVLIDRFLPDLEQVAPQYAALLFAAGKFLDGVGEYDRAFAFFSRANSLSARKYDAEMVEVWNKRAVETFTQEFLANSPSSSPGPVTPVFIVGMPRSGTSLTEKILTSHPEVFGAGETGALSHIAATMARRCGTDHLSPECLATFDESERQRCVSTYFELFDQETLHQFRYVTDKSLDNVFNIGLIHLLFPNSPIIYCRRDPKDIALSCFMQNFSSSGLNFSFDLGSIAHYQRHYLDLMAHWQRLLPGRIHELQYEKLVRDFGDETRKLLDFCNLSWHESCLEPHRSRHVSATASHDQTRRPLYDSSIARWKHYQKHLEPFDRAFDPS